MELLVLTIEPASSVEFSIDVDTETGSISQPQIVDVHCINRTMDDPGVGGSYIEIPRDLESDDWGR